MAAVSPELAVTYLNIVLYAVSYQLQRPVEPFLVRSLIRDSGADADGEEESATNQTYGRLTSFFSSIQTVGSPLVGTLLDRIGPKRTSILVYCASAASYGILAHATTPRWLYFSKIPTLLQHAFLVGQATVSSVEEDDDENGSSSAKRAAALGRLTTAYTIGATIGPALGGYLASNDLYAGARLAIWGSLVSVLLSILYLKDHNKKSKDGSEDETRCSTPHQPKTEMSFLQSFQKTLLFMRHPTIGPLLFIKLLNGVSSSAFSTILPLILANKLHFSTTQLGYFMSASSLSVALFAAVGISPAMRYVQNRAERLASIGIACRLISVANFGVIVSLVVSNLMAESTLENEMKISYRAFTITTLASVTISLSSHLHATSLTTVTTGSVPVEERGAVVGLEHGLFSMARIVGPPMGTMLLSHGPPILMPGLGIDGLWRVILVTALMDFALLALLKAWSARQLLVQSCGTESIRSAAGGLDGIPSSDNHDHSD